MGSSTVVDTNNAEIATMQAALAVSSWIHVHRCSTGCASIFT
jgi:hypothetical protein